MKTLLVLEITLVVGFQTEVLRADPCSVPGPGCDCQVPDGVEGWDSNTGSRGFNDRVADNFIALANREILSITWWGGYFNWDILAPGQPDDQAFSIRVYEDDNGLPGALISAVFTDSLTDLQVANVLGNTFEFLFRPLDEQKYVYVFDAQDRPALSSGHMYWLEIVETQNNNFIWAWESSSSGDALILSDIDSLGYEWPDDAINGVDVSWCMELGALPPGPAIPALSDAGLAALAVLLIAAGTVVVRRRAAFSRSRY